MKALLSQAAGGPETLVLADRPVPTAGRGELLVKVLVCAINYPDVLIIEDKYQFKPERPFAPGSEICAEVAASFFCIAGSVRQVSILATRSESLQS